MSAYAAAPPFIAGIATVALLPRNDVLDISVMSSVSETYHGKEYHVTTT